MTASGGVRPPHSARWRFSLNEETGEKKYLKVAKGALDWMTHQDFREVKPITFQQRPSGIIFYYFELYATGLRYLKPGSQQYERAIRQIDLAMDWMARNQKMRGAKVPDYVVRNVDMAGLPYLMYAFARQLPQHRGLTGPADCELRYIGDLLLRDGKPNVSRLMVWEVMTWGMMSYAERLSPGVMHRSSKWLRSVPASKPSAIAPKETSVITFEETHGYLQQRTHPTRDSRHIPYCAIHLVQRRAGGLVSAVMRRPTMVWLDNSKSREVN